MLFFNILKASCVNFSTQSTAMISFDEGPSKNIDLLLQTASRYRIPVVFHLDPTLDTFTRETVDKILNAGFEVGMAVTDKLDEDEANIKEVLERFTTEFTRKSGYKAILCRLPAVGIISRKAEKIAEDMGYVVTEPSLDSEDDQKADIWPFIQPYLMKLYQRPLSAVFRDRYQKSVNLLPQIAQIIYSRYYKIVPAYTFTGKNTNLIKASVENNYTSENSLYSVKMSINPTEKIIHVVALDSDDYKIKEMDVLLTTENKLKVRDLLKKQVKNEKDIDDLFSSMEDLTKKEEEEVNADEKVHTAKENGVDKIMIMSILIFNFLFVVSFN
ncbi:hypothetical protein NGRA_1519 [Nosema granulosis]|uniref:NodB homology domain-containing protein n=1 Tax=Nosema granulosis TaxID=83296 RepID=A0A9P6GYB3_9MICR|nr:hypothetical protein NGRA_1519 [Nosema granulosis]